MSQYRVFHTKYNKYIYIWRMNASLFLFSLLFCFALHFLIQKIFIYFKKFDDFNHRSSHKTLATRTGGIGIFLNLFIISAFFYISNIQIFDYSLFIPFGIMFIVGVYDDFYKADFKLKFFLQIITAKIMIDQGYVISNYYGLFGIYEISWVISQITTVFVFLVVVNAINFIDGIDGLAISQFIKSIIIVELFSQKLSLISVIGFICIGSLIPLYFYNFKHKKKVFLGDGGSMLLGTILMLFLLHILGPDFNFKSYLSINKTIFSVLVVLYPLLDLLRVFVLRIISGNSPFVADNNHIHHRLLSFYGGSHIKSLLSILTIEILTIFLLTKLLIYF